MRPPFEIWAAQEIANLRAEADALQRTLDRYLGQPDNSAARRASVEAAAVSSRPPMTDISKGSKYRPLYGYFDEAGPAGLTIEEIARRMDQEGIATKRSSLRAFLWNQKELGRLFSRDGRYVAAKYQVTGEPEADASNSPDLLEGAV